MPKHELPDYKCACCGDKNAPWGFHEKFYCSEHRAAGEVLFRSMNDGHTAAAGLPEDESVKEFGPAQRTLI